MGEEKNGGEKGYYFTSPKWGGSDFRPSVLEVKSTIPHYFYPDRFQCLSKLQRGGYVALEGISFGLRRWQPRLVEAPRLEPCDRGRPEAVGNGRGIFPGIPEGGDV